MVPKQEKQMQRVKAQKKRLEKTPKVIIKTMNKNDTFR